MRQTRQPTLLVEIDHIKEGRIGCLFILERQHSYWGIEIGYVIIG